MPVPALSDRATSDLRFIRDAMARSGRFTALSGPGIVAMGALGLAAALVAPRPADSGPALVVWFCAAALAAAAGGVGILRKSREEDRRVLAGPGRRFLLAFLPPVAAGVPLTFLLAGSGAADLLPGLWLLLYGAGMVAGGQASVALVPLTGLGFMLLGSAALLLPEPGPAICLGAGFGGLHIGAGVMIWRRHGG